MSFDVFSLFSLLLAFFFALLALQDLSSKKLRVSGTRFNSWMYFSASLDIKSSSDNSEVSLNF